MFNEITDPHKPKHSSKRQRFERPPARHDGYLVVIDREEGWVANCFYHGRAEQWARMYGGRIMPAKLARVDPKARKYKFLDLEPPEKNEG